MYRGTHCAFTLRSFTHSPLYSEKKKGKKYAFHEKAIGRVAHNSIAHKSANERCKLRLLQKNASKVRGNRLTVPWTELRFLLSRNIILYIPRVFSLKSTSARVFQFFNIYKENSLNIQSRIL